MGTLCKDEIERRLKKNELLKFARCRNDGTFDLEPASYDLMAGIAVWKGPRQGTSRGEICSIHYLPNKPFTEQPTVTLQPGQMMFVITREELQMPTDICGTVMSRNKLAREGILALNAGHIDPGFHGPIVIRLINLRSTQWTLTMSEPIFTVVFHTVNTGSDDKLVKHRAISLEETLKMVRESADEALSNALFDLYAGQMEESLQIHYASVEARIRSSLSQDFIRKSTVFNWVMVIGVLISVIALVVAMIEAWLKIEGFIGGLF